MGTESLKKVSEATNRTLRLWLRGQKRDMKIHRIPTKYLYFNIENGRYADKMLQLKADHPGVHIDAKEKQWKDQIYTMLKGEYVGGIGTEGTEKDKVAFERLREDIKKREQLTPGIVLSDGGVVDGNRRLAVLLSLGEQRFSRFEGVILPEDVTSEDRWRIEVGVQLGKDQKLDYSPVNQLLKIKEGLKLYKDMRGMKQLPPGQTPEKMVADALFGVSVNEVLDSIDRLNLIDEYLDFFKIKGQYFYVADKSERFIEAVNVLRAAERLPVHERAKLKAQLFIIIREELMNNWEMRRINNALGGDPTSRGRKSKPVEKAIEHLITHTTDPKRARDAYVSNTHNKIVEKSKTVCREFLDIFDAEREFNKPLNLVKDARTKLAVFQESLKNFKEREDLIAIFKELVLIKKIVKACFGSIKVPKSKKKR